MARLAMITLAAAVLLSPAGPRAQEKGDDKAADAPAGSWKVYLPLVSDSGSQAKLIVKFEPKGAGWEGEVVSTAPRWPNQKVERVTVADGLLRFQLASNEFTLPCELKLGKDPKAAKLYGRATLRKKDTPVELERTTSSSLDPVDQLREAFAKQALGYEAIPMSLQLLSQSEKLKAKPAEVRAWAEKAIKSADLYYPALQRDVLLTVAQILTEEKGHENTALQYARRAERLLDPKEPPAAQKRVLDVLVGVLEKAGKEAEVKDAQAKLAKLDFRIKVKPFAGRKAKSDRVVLVELFTGAQCPPCVAADLAFDAIGKTYGAREVALVQYHIHVPAPDPLTCPDSEGRFQFYEDSVKGAPAILFNGRSGPGGGGPREDAPEKYDEYVDELDRLMEQPAKAEVKVAASRKGDKVSITAEVDKLDVTGDDVRLRVVLVEEEVAYKGTNGIAAHRHVVRAMPGGPDGVVMAAKGVKKTYEVDLAELKKKLADYLEKFGEKNKFPNKERPLELKKLKVIAFVQNDRGGEVLQAVQADVGE
ncbi:MAG: hypothetical protein U0797_22005 [Gemmataceae bacterium]